MAKFRGAIVVDNEKCKGCGLCVAACPTKVIDLHSEVNGKGYHYAYMKEPEACIGSSFSTAHTSDAIFTQWAAMRRRQDFPVSM